MGCRTLDGGDPPALFSVVPLLIKTQDNNRMAETENAEMFVKGKGVAETMGVDEGKARAVGKAQTGNVMPMEYGLGCSFNRFRNPQNSYTGLTEGIHEIDGGSMTGAGVQQGIEFVEYKVGSEKSEVLIRHRQENFLCPGIVEIARERCSAQRSGVNEHLHNGSLPYRYSSWFAERSLAVHSSERSKIAAIGAVFFAFVREEGIETLTNACSGRSTGVCGTNTPCS